MKKYRNIITPLLLIFILGLHFVQPVKAWNDVITCTVLGDSIAKGYSAHKEDKIKCYGEIISDKLVAENGATPNYKNYAVSGLDTQGLNEKILSQDEVREQLGESQVIFVTMGSNDLLNEFKTVAQTLLNSETKYKSAGQAFGELEEGVKKNPLLVFKVIDALSKWDYGTFESRWAEAMGTIQQHKAEGAQVIVTNIYNPVFNMNLPGAMNKVVEDIIDNMNSIIDKRADEFGYTVVDLFDSSIVANVQDDGLHPNQDGQQMIADIVYQEIRNPDEKSTSQSVDGVAIKEENNLVDDNAKVEESNVAINKWTAGGSIVFVLLLIMLIMYRSKKDDKK